MPIIFFSGVGVWVGVGVGLGVGMGMGDRRITLSSIDVRVCVLCICTRVYFLMRITHAQYTNTHAYRTKGNASGKIPRPPSQPQPKPSPKPLPTLHPSKKNDWYTVSGG